MENTKELNSETGKVVKTLQKQIKELENLVKETTNGYCQRRLKELINEMKYLEATLQTAEHSGWRLREDLNLV
jgi:cell division FtsZ-interacting protein ZapD